MRANSARHKIEDTERKCQAIANAFRVAALSTQEKALPHLAQQYQDLMHLSANIDDPKVYYDTLEAARVNHNRAAGIQNPEVAHKIHLKALNEYYAWFHAHHPRLSPSQAREAADREVQIYQYEIEDKMAREKPDKIIEERDVFKELERKLKNFVKPHKEAADAIYPGLDHPKAYPGFHQHSCFGMAQASRHIEDLLHYAREDIAKGGKGHHFRDRVLDKNIKHIGPREIGLAWHLLSPNKSELSYIDHLVLDALGIKPKEANPRDYSLYERMLMASRDGAGYDHMPLSHFQKGLIDSYQGAVSHEPLAVHDPVRVAHADWTLKPAPHLWPQWWEETKPYREKVKKEWNENEGRYNPPQTVMASIELSGTSQLFHGFKKGVGDIYYTLPFMSDVTKLAGTPISMREFISDVGYRVMRVSFAENDLWKKLGMYQSFLDITGIDYKKEAPSLSIVRTRLLVDPKLAKLATIGPNMDNEINDPLANDAGDPMPSWEWLSEKDPCKTCQGNEYIMINGKKTVCPSCSAWQDKQLNDPSVPDPTYGDNPSGVHELAPGTTGP